MVILGNLPGTDIYRNVDHYKEARRIPGFLMLAIEAPINFANTTYLTERHGLHIYRHLYPSSAYKLLLIAENVSNILTLVQNHSVGGR